jgi:hypothetical protein
VKELQGKYRRVIELDSSREPEGTPEFALPVGIGRLKNG